MVDELGSVPSLYVAGSRDVLPFPGGGPSRKRAVVQNIQQASAGQQDRPGFSASIARIRAYAEQRAEAAVQLRQFQKNTRRADELLAEIKEQLTRIVKQYPPFAQDDPQRLAYLNAITGLRKQLDALTFPPERQSRADLSAEEAERTVIPPVPGKQLIDLPDLDPGNTRDAELETALDAIQKAQGEVRKLQGSMWQDVVRVVGEANLGSNGDGQAQAKAGEVREYVASNTGRGIGLSLNTIQSLGI